MTTEKIILPNDWAIEEGKNLFVLKTWEDRFKYAEVEVSEEKHFHFEVNGMKFQLSVGDHGFTLWDNDQQQVVLDASMLGVVAYFRITPNDVLRGIILQPGKELGQIETRKKIIIE